MALFEKHTLFGVGIGAGAVIAIPFARPVLAAIARPIVKTTIKQVLVAYERGRELLARMTEALEDVMAEVRAEAGDALSEPARVVVACASTDEPMAQAAWAIPVTQRGDS
jgi:hypothetical protein